MRSRFRLLLLLIVLTALRGLAGPAMAAGMALPQGPAAVVQMAASHAHGATAAHDGALHAAHDAHGSDSMAHASSATPCHGDIGLPAAHDCGPGHGGDPSTPSHAACADCEICHTALLAPAVGATPPAARHAGRMTAAATRFASAGAALPIKPPIS